MSSLERRLLFFAMTLLFLAFIIWTAGEGRFPTAIALAASATPNASTFTYYGADISVNGGMAVATGVQPTNTRPSNGPWPQYTRNYCFIAVVQAVANYGYWKQGKAIPFPHQNNQGPLNDNPNSETRINPHQILYDMDHYMKPTFGTITPTGSGSSRRPFTLADSSRDFGGDPRAQAYAAWYETPNLYHYHQYIYHNGVGGATYGLAKGVAFSFSDGPAPEIAIVNHGEHLVIIAGVWASANPSTNSAATIDSFAVYNPWDQLNFGSYLNGAYYAQVLTPTGSRAVGGGDRPIVPTMAPTPIPSLASIRLALAQAIPTRSTGLATTSAFSATTTPPTMPIIRLMKTARPCRILNAAHASG